MSTKTSKQGYILSCVANKALAQLKPRLRADAMRSFTPADEMFDVLTTAFGYANEKQKNPGL